LAAIFLSCGGQVGDPGPDAGFGGADSGFGGSGGSASPFGSGGSLGTGGSFGIGGSLGTGGGSGGASGGSGGTFESTFGICPTGEWDSTLPLSDGKGCIPWTFAECGPGQALEQKGTAIYDYLCVDCAPGTFTDLPDQPYCLELTECSLAEVEATPGTSSHDTECAPTEPFGFVDPDNFYMATALAANADGLWTAGQTVDNGLALYAITYEGESELLFTSPPGAYADVGSLALLGADSLVLAGITNPDPTASTDSEVYVHRLSLSGDETWSRTFSSSGSGYEYDVAASIGPSETIYVAGTTYGELASPLANGSDIFVRKYEGNGDVAWTRQLDVEPNGDLFYGFVAGPEGNVYFTSRRNNAELGTYLTALDENGDPLWELDSGDIGCGWCTDLAVDAAGDLYVAGTNAGSGTSYYNIADVVLTRLSPDGTVKWTSVSADDTMQAVTALVLDGGVVHVLGGAGPFPAYEIEDALRIDFDTSGQLLGRSVWGGSADEWLYAGAVTPDGDLFIAGGVARSRDYYSSAMAYVAKWPDL